MFTTNNLIQENIMETMKQVVNVDVTLTQIALMYAWTFQEKKPEEITYRQAADKIMEKLSYDMLEIMIRESRRVCSDFDLYTQEMKKFGGEK